MKKLLLAVWILISMPVFASDQKLTEIGPMFGGSYINVNIARGDALFTAGGYQYVSYFNPNGDIIVGRRSGARGPFEKFSIEPREKIDLSNPHNYISMQVDHEGYLHLSYGNHNSPINYLRSSVSYEITHWEAPKTVLNREKQVTYVKFFRDQETLFAMYRRGTHGYGSQILARYDASTQTWSKVHDPLVAAQGASPYFWRPVTAPDGTIHLFFTWRLSSYKDNSENPIAKSHFSGFTNTDIYHIQSQDAGETWTTIEGKELKIPIGRTSKAKIKDIPIGEDFFNHFGAAVGPQGDPYIVYTHWDNATRRVAQQHITYWNGKSWKSYQVTNYEKPIRWTRPQQEGRASTDLARGNIAVDEDGTTYIFSRSKEHGNIIELYTSNGNNYNRWSKRAIYDDSVGGWEPLYDKTLFENEKRMQLLVVGVTDEDVVDTYGEQERVSLLRRITKWWRAIQIRYMGKEVRDIDYYSDDNTAQLLPIGQKLKNDTGYILEIEL